MFSEAELLSRRSYEKKYMHGEEMVISCSLEKCLSSNAKHAIKWYRDRSYLLVRFNRPNLGVTSMLVTDVIDQMCY